MNNDAFGVSKGYVGDKLVQAKTALSSRRKA